MNKSPVYSDIKYKLTEDELILSIPTGPSLQEFNKLLNKALNCYPECPPEWKHLADIIQHGSPLMDYYAQDSACKMRHKEKP
jgi:hypothetical protein